VKQVKAYKRAKALRIARKKEAVAEYEMKEALRKSSIKRAAINKRNKALKKSRKETSRKESIR